MGLEANQLIATSQVPLICRTIEMSAGYVDAEHSHPWHQIIYPMQGTLRTRVEDSIYFVPGNIAVFIPANTTHSSVAISDTQFIGVYFSPGIFSASQHIALPSPELPKDCQLLQLSPFLKSFILEIVTQSEVKSTPTCSTLRLYQVFIEQLMLASKLTLNLVMPTDKRLLQITDRIIKEPANKQTLDSLAKSAGASARTTSRLFKKETGMSFRQWRQRIRLLNGISLLETGLRVEDVAFELNYESVSAFVYAFRCQFGMPPGKFMQSKNQPV